MLLVVDNGSVFTKNLSGLLRDRDVRFDLKSPGETEPGMLDAYDLFILSGRRSNEKEINRINAAVIRHAVTRGSRLLGICYGAEILALTLGGTIKRLDAAHRGAESVRVTRDNPIAGGRLDVFESHSFAISKLPDSLEPVAESDVCRYEIIRHRELPMFGTQFHPEMSRDGHGLIQRFCSL